MSEKSRLDVLDLERLAKKRIVHQVYLSDGQIVRSTPVSVDAT
jgi:hypothetical protein